MAAPDHQTAAAVEALGATAFSGTVFRHVGLSYDPLSGSGARMQGGRWNPPNSFSTLYLAPDVLTVVAEFVRSAARARRSVEDFMPRNLHEYEVSLSSALDLSSDSALKAVGLGLDDVSADDLAKCQSVGSAAHGLGFEAILAPSATSRGLVLALFTDRLDAGSGIEVVSRKRWNEIPARYLDALQSDG